MNLQTLSPEAARQRMAQGALLVDIRARDEYAREHIGAALHIPLAQLTPGAAQLAGAPAVIFHCRSGQRTRMAAAQLCACAPCETFVLDGGLDAWKRAGLPVAQDAAAPLELQRQVQIAAGALVLTGTVLGLVLSPWFFGLSGFVGAGLVFAGLSGFCGMARLLVKMPWNRRMQST